MITFRKLTSQKWFRLFIFGILINIGIAFKMNERPMSRDKTEQAEKK